MVIRVDFLIPMKIGKNKVVLIDYTLKDDAGEVIDTSKGGEPLAYIQGVGNIIPGLEEALEGSSVGDKMSVKIVPEKGYGKRDESLLHVLTKDQFSGVDKLEVGMQFHAHGDNGSVQSVTIQKIEGDDVTIDGNHPLAGINLNFDVSVIEVRDATLEELAHGHVHGPGGHHH